MTKLVKFLLLILTALVLNSELKAQKFIAIDKGGRNKRIRFYAGDYMSLKTKDGIKINGQISRIDSIHFFIGSEKILLKDIHLVYKDNSIYGLSLLSKVTFIAGLGYFAIDSGNRLINKENPIIHNETIQLSSGFLGISLLSGIISNKRYKIGKRHPIKIIDISI